MPTADPGLLDHDRCFSVSFANLVFGPGATREVGDHARELGLAVHLDGARLWNAAVAAGVRHVVYTSFVGSDASNPSMAAKDHIITEQLLRQSGLDFTFLRNAQYSEAVLDAMGPAVIASGLMLSVAGDGAMAFVCRDDCAAAAAAVLASSGHEGQTYDITGPDLISYREVAQLIADVSGAPVTFELTDEAGLYAMFDALGIPRKPVDGQNVNNFPWNSDDMVSFEVAVRDGYFAVFSNHVEQLTGRRPRSLRSLLEDNRDALMAGAARIAAPA